MVALEKDNKNVDMVKKGVRDTIRNRCRYSLAMDVVMIGRMTVVAMRHTIRVLTIIFALLLPTVTLILTL